MKKVVVYTTDYCPYCTRAKQLLKNKGVPFEEIQIDGNDPKVWQELYQRSKMKTVPQIFIDGKIVGGFTELSALENKGELDELLA
jgi:glutaredoxin 3